MTQKQLSIVQGHECMSAWQTRICKLGYSAGGDSGVDLGVSNGRFAAKKASGSGKAEERQGAPGTWSPRHLRWST
eukprot:CAMPEP_0174380270 /NCGR_PEP_ID=MMETSP0811_2-20130205/123264_1 /TAXON_ID=73025 ORGANISM="Eutreptiella gymnastica-like, Strain CCMP1594" /NCGR_SAMPLE_ID=MMETSP0811_2 /ASSEMBLY_ACC=CAM_ASM_000667 /LENGTH=74 /DNA_ID=CAMNT_0015533081 /DNA_START=159 /DNA_END=383 /DNA_ORIENTATION=+